MERKRMKTQVETEIELPQPEHDARCTDVLSDLLIGYAGVQQADFDVEDGRLNLVYDPGVISNEHALRLVRKAGEEAYGRVLHCQSKGAEACAACASQMGAQLAGHFENLRHFPAQADTTYDLSLIHI